MPTERFAARSPRRRATAALRAVAAATLLTAVVAPLTTATLAADFTKRIQVEPGVEIMAVATWFVASCTKALGTGSYSVTSPPASGTVWVSAASGPVPGCSASAPPQPGAIAYYTWTGAPSGPGTDKFSLHYDVGGRSETIDIFVTLKPLPVQADGCTITSKTLATVTGQNDTRTRLGVGESVVLSAPSPAVWSVTAGKGTIRTTAVPATMYPSVFGFPSRQCGNDAVTSQNEGTASVCFVAPMSDDVSTIVATSGSSTCSINFTTVRPSGIMFRRVKAPPMPGKGYHFEHDRVAGYRVGFIDAVFVTPADVSFVNVRFSELDIKDNFYTNSYKMFEIPDDAGGTARGWYINCDHVDREIVDQGIIGDPNNASSRWIYSGLADTSHNDFTSVLTTLERKNGSYILTKRQEMGVGSGGGYSPTPNSLAATITIPGSDASLSPMAVPDLKACSGYIEEQFRRVQ